MPMYVQRKPLGLIYLFLLFALFTTAIPAAAVAEEIHAGWGVGWYGASINATVVDDGGPTSSGSDSSLLNLLVVSPPDRDDRFLTHLYSQDFKLEASTTNIGQKIERSGGSISYQTRLRLMRAWKPWFGLGLGYVTESHTARHTLRTDGFLGKTFSDESSSGGVVLANFTSDFSITERWSAGLHLQYEHPLGGTAQVTTVGVAVLYQIK